MAVQIRWVDAQGVKPWPKLVMASTTGAVWLGEQPARKALLHERRERHTGDGRTA